MEKQTEFIKSLIRPFLIVWGFVVYGICVLNGVEIPDPLTALIIAIIIEYFGERAILRIKEMK